MATSLWSYHTTITSQQQEKEGAPDNNAPAHAYSSPPVRCQVLSQQVDLLLKYARNRLMDQFHGMCFANREIFCRQQNPRLLAASDRG